MTTYKIGLNASNQVPIVAVSFDDGSGNAVVVSAANPLPGTGGGGGGPTLIGSVTTSGSQASVDFPTIPAGLHELTLKFIGRSSAVSDNDELRVRANADSGTNYTAGRIGQDSGSAFANGWINQTSAPVGYLAGATSGGPAVGAGIVRVPFYDSAAWDKPMLGSFQGYGSDGRMYQGVINATWGSAAPITHLNVFPLGGTFVDGSVVELWGA